MNTDILFNEFRTEKLVLRNRIVMPAMTRRFSPGGVPTHEVAQYYARRAEGGVGLIITEGTTIDRPAASNDSAIPNFFSGESLQAWRRVVAAVHEAGAKIAPQLWHQGLARDKNSGPRPEAQSEGPSAGNEGREMSDADLADTIAAFASAARHARQIGFDAVELHGAHGYLLDQFLWSGTNRRTDGYGGDLAGRTRFAAEVVRAVRQAVGPDFPLIFRFSQWKLQDYSARLANTPEELEQLLTPLADAGVDIFHASTRRFWQPEFAGSALNLAGWARRVTGRPAISVGSVSLGGEDFMEHLRKRADGAPVVGIEELLERMRNQEFDLIAVGRALIANPDWPKLVREGRFAELVDFDRAILSELK